MTQSIIFLKYIYSASMKTYQYLNFDILPNTTATFTFMFLVNDRLIWEINSFTSPGTMVHVMHVLFMFFAVFKNLKSSFLVDNMSVHALYIFIENATKMVLIIPLNTQKKG